MSRMSSHLAAPLLLAAIAIAAALCLHGAVAAAPGPADTVAASCDAIRDFVDVAFCVSHLRSVPGAASADRRGHLLMAADLAAAAGSAARDAAASALARGERDPTAADALRACEFVYGAASVPALRFMRGYAAAGSWAAAESLLLLTPQGGIGCEAALKGTAGKAAGDMAAANREFSQLNTMATALLNAVS